MTIQQSRNAKPEDRAEREDAPVPNSRSASAPTSQDTKTQKSASAFRTISEVADELDVQQHVLRFWETKFSHVRPLKRGGGRRYYRPEDVELLKAIHHLLYTEGYTIKGVQKLMREQGKNALVRNYDQPARPLTGQQANVAGKAKLTTQTAEALSKKQRAILETMLGELKDLRSMIRDDES